MIEFRINRYNVETIHPPYCHRHVYTVHMHFKMIELTKVMEIWVINRIERTMQWKNQLQNKQTNKQNKLKKIGFCDHFDDEQSNWNSMLFNDGGCCDLNIKIENLNWIFIHTHERLNEWYWVLMCQLLNDMFFLCMYVCVGSVFMVLSLNNQRTASMLAACEFFSASFVLQIFCICSFFLSFLYSLTQLKSNCTYQTLCLILWLWPLFSFRMTNYRKNVNVEIA